MLQIWVSVNKCCRSVWSSLILSKHELCVSYIVMFVFIKVVLSPPPNVTVQRVKGGDLLVQWDTPYSQWTSNSACFEYELSINNQEVQLQQHAHGSMPVCVYAKRCVLTQNCTTTVCLCVCYLCVIKPRTIKKLLDYTEPNADPSLAYQVKIRTKPNEECHEVHHWSAWSSTIGEQS